MNTDNNKRNRNTESSSTGSPQSPKRPRLENTVAPATPFASAVGEPPSPPSGPMESYLSVPLREVIFREITPSPLSQQQRQRRSKSLCTRAETQVLLRIHLLAYELDQLAALCSKVLSNQWEFQQLETKLLGKNNNAPPYLRPLLPLLRMHPHVESAMSYVRSQGDRILSDLQSCARTLKQCAEQNWDVADSIEDATGMTTRVAQEKRALATIQDELCNRLDLLRDRSRGNDELPDSSIESMADFCARTFRQATQDPDMNASPEQPSVAAATPPSTRIVQRDEADACATMRSLKSHSESSPEQEEQPKLSQPSWSSASKPTAPTPRQSQAEFQHSQSSSHHPHGLPQELHLPSRGGWRSCGHAESSNSPLQGLVPEAVTALSSFSSKSTEAPK